MLISVLLFCTVVCYSLLVSQSFMYMIALAHVQRELDAPGYTRLRQLLDVRFNRWYRPIVYTTVVSNLALLASTAGKATNLFPAALLAFVALLLDIILALRGNMPINKKIATWTSANYPVDWFIYRTEWLKIFSYRQLANVTGFIALVAASVFRTH